MDAPALALALTLALAFALTSLQTPLARPRGAPDDSGRVEPVCVLGADIDCCTAATPCPWATTAAGVEALRGAGSAVRAVAPKAGAPRNVVVLACAPTEAGLGRAAWGHAAAAFATGRGARCGEGPRPPATSRCSMEGLLGALATATARSGEADACLCGTGGAGLLRGTEGFLGVCSAASAPITRAGGVAMVRLTLTLRRPLELAPAPTSTSGISPSKPSERICSLVSVARPTNSSCFPQSLS
mmetsp:Transcript_106552/g.343792  ORF Transcript_106552/g.343792 Transcript_106552/m.343792 type:complete len:243 (+) Transcript_106552:409-1137(+)